MPPALHNGPNPRGDSGSRDLHSPGLSLFLRGSWQAGNSGTSLHPGIAALRSHPLLPQPHLTPSPAG